MTTRGGRGFTLLEMVIAMGVSLVLIGMVVTALVGLGRDRASRELVIEVQEEARLGVGILEADLRSGSLGAATGIVTASGVAVPMVQVYENVAGGFLGAKPGTDALLVVQALSTAVIDGAPASPRATVKGDHFGGKVLEVTRLAPFHAGDAVLFGEYGNAGWAHVVEIDEDRRLLTLDAAIARVGGLGAEEKLPSGSLVRPARARLYYVNARDELVRVSLAAPAPPAAAEDVAGRAEVLATAFENLQLDVQLDPGGPPPASCSVAGAEAEAALAPESARLSSACAPALRTVAVSAVVHSRHPLRDMNGDAALAIEDVQLAPAGASDGDAFVRRAYQLLVAVRNTSLEVL